MQLNKMLKGLEKQGCWPCLSRRGDHTWRAHVNATGNYWDEASTPLAALTKAVRLWEKAGRPVDGLAAEAAICCWECRWKCRGK